MVRSVSFDDPDDEDLFVFSGSDLLTSHYDIADLDWQEVAERSCLDERRGLVIAQVAVLEDLVDDFICYLVDPEDPDQLSEQLDRQTIGPRLERLERCLKDAGLLDERAEELLDDLRSMVHRRNELAHGSLHCRPSGAWPKMPLSQELELEWVITSRRSGTPRRITMRGLRQDLHDAIGIFMAMLGYAEQFVEVAPRPKHFARGQYLSAPSP